MQQLLNHALHCIRVLIAAQFGSFEDAVALMEKALSELGERLSSHLRHFTMTRQRLLAANFDS